MLLNDEGQITYLGDDEVLSELVILNPEWLSKAIGHVMEDEDGAIRAARGVLDHGHLGQIWRDRPGEPTYSRRLYPYFLRVRTAQTDHLANQVDLTWVSRDARPTQYLADMCHYLTSTYELNCGTD
jgi:hypothetical protein